jgi:hypothetical protein
MAKITTKDVTMINFLLNQSYLPNHTILDYDMVTFKNGRGRYSPKTELLVVRSMERNQPAGNVMVSYTTFYVKRETLCNEIESLIKQ